MMSTLRRSELPLTPSSSRLSMIDTASGDYPELYLQGEDSKPTPTLGTHPKPEAATATTPRPSRSSHLRNQCPLAAPVRTSASQPSASSLHVDTGSHSCPPNFAEPSPHGDLLEWRLQVIEQQKAAAAAHSECFADQLERHMIAMRRGRGSPHWGNLQKTWPVAAVESSTGTASGRRPGHKLTRSGGAQPGSGHGIQMSLSAKDVTCASASLSRSGSGASTSVGQAGMRRRASSGSLQPQAEAEIRDNIIATTNSSISSLPVIGPMSSMSPRFAGGQHDGHKINSPQLLSHSSWHPAEGPATSSSTGHHPPTTLLHKVVPAAPQLELPAGNGSGSGNARSTAGGPKQRRFIAEGASGTNAGSAAVAVAETASSLTGFTHENDPGRSPAEGCDSPTSPAFPLLQLPPPHSPSHSPNSLSHLALNDATLQGTHSQSKRSFHMAKSHSRHAQHEGHTFQAFNSSAQDIMLPVAGCPRWEGRAHPKSDTHRRPSHSTPCLPISTFLELSPSLDAEGVVTMATGSSTSGFDVDTKAGRKLKGLRNGLSEARNGYGELGGLRQSSSRKHGVRQRNDAVVEGNSSFLHSHSSSAVFNEVEDLTFGFYSKPRSISRQASSHES